MKVATMKIHVDGLTDRQLNELARYIQRQQTRREQMKIRI